MFKGLSFGEKYENSRYNLKGKAQKKDINIEDIVFSLLIVQNSI